MPQVSNEIDEAYYFAFVCPSVRLSVHQAFLCMPYLKNPACQGFEFYIWVPNEKIAALYFFPCPACLFRDMPL